MSDQPGIGQKPDFEEGELLPDERGRNAEEPELRGVKAGQSGVPETEPQARNASALASGTDTGSMAIDGQVVVERSDKGFLVKVEGPESKSESPRSESAEGGPKAELSPDSLKAGHQTGRPTEPIPARMLNEFVYCPRLFYYEFVEGVFIENADTLRGSAIHQKVDSGSGAMPGTKTKSKDKSPKSKEVDSKVDGERSDSLKSKGKNNEQAQESGEPGEQTGPELIHSRSVQMGSERLGVVAKMDLVETKIESSDQSPKEGTSPRPSPHEKGSGENSALTPGPLPQGEGERGEGGGKAKAAAAGQMDFSEDLFTNVEVCPVDYKAGAPKEGVDANELWDTDKMQLGLQALILRDNGYVCNEGVIYYRATKQRVRLPITPELEQWVLQQINEARIVITRPIPAPLVHSPKCVRCSLAPVCLPDETRMLTGVESAKSEVEHGEVGNQSRLTSSATGEGQPVRRLMAARDDARPLYLNTQGFRVGCKDEVLQVKEKDKVVDECRMRDVSHVALFGNIQISTQAIQSLCEMEVPVTYFSMGGWFYGITRGHELKNVFLRMEQFRLARDQTVCLSLARRFVHGKIRNHRTMLMRNHLEPPEPAILKLKRASEDALEAPSLEVLLGIEGAAASQYFQQFSGMIKIADELADPEAAAAQEAGQLAFNFNFANRNRRPPTDPVNAMLSLAYSLLSKDCTLAAMAVGFDPYIGFYHQPRFGRPALGLDLMEEFRPLVAESTVLSCINNRVVTEKDFVRAGEAVNLSAAGRKRFFQTYEQRMSSLITHPLFDYKVSYRRALELQARLLGKALTGEIGEYIPLLTR